MGLEQIGNGALSRRYSTRQSNDPHSLDQFQVVCQNPDLPGTGRGSKLGLNANVFSS